MRLHLKLLLLFALLGLKAGVALGAKAEVLFGPPCFGGGASNGPTLTAIDYQFNFVTTAGTETVVSIYPGLLIGHRFDRGPFYFSLGGGVVLSTLTGFGIYSAFGYQSGTGAGWHFIAEYRHAAGLAAGGRYSAPKALRIGLQYEF